ncbi:MAG: hydrogenase small subunit [Bacillus sp. (in: Bacteria)]|nr:hydrogenase small subunit [Bacillus sp. (in: firmicutes)]
MNFTKRKTIYEDLVDRGVSRRDFLKMCTILSATMGLSVSQTESIAHALESKSRVPVIWLQLAECTGCSESFIRTNHPRAENVLLDLVSVEYWKLLSAAAGDRALANKKRVIEEHKGEYIVIVEGNVCDDEYLIAAGTSSRETLLEVTKNAKAVLAYGTCSAYGGLSAAKPNPTNAKSVSDVVKNVPVINVPGCPPIAEVMSGIISHIITFDRLPELDAQGRPKTFFNLRLHDKCYRRGYFDAGLFVENFDDEGAKIGYCLYKVGCVGPTTYSSCGEMRWNGGVSFPVQSGNPCIGCTEKDFWDNGPFFTRRAKIPGTQTTVNPETLGLYAIGATVAGVAAHAGITAIKKNKDEKKKDQSSIDGGDKG